LVEFGSDSVESYPQFTVENQQDLFPIRSVSDAFEVGRDFETPGAQLTTSARRGNVGAETGAVRLERGRLCWADNGHLNPPKIDKLAVLIDKQHV
jgi:hypothetical protein